jgi:hypothetical protein
LLEDIWGSREVEGQAALVIRDRIVDARLIQQQSHNLPSTLLSCNMQRRVPILISRIDIDRPRTV